MIRLTWRTRPLGYAKVSQERVKNGGPGGGSSATLVAGGGRTTGRPLTDCRWVHRRLPLPQERVKRGPALRDRGASGVGARKTPHPAAGPPASPGGRGKRGRAPEDEGSYAKVSEEGKERRLLEGIGTAHPPAKRARASPRGETRGRAPEDGGYAKVSQERVKSGAALGRLTPHTRRSGFAKVSSERDPCITLGRSSGRPSCGRGEGRGQERLLP